MFRVNSFASARTLLVTLWSLVTAFTVPAAGPHTSSDEFDPAFRLVRDAVEKNEVPGAAALVARGGKIVRHEAYGLRDIENRLPFTTNTLCWIASITKPVTVAAAMTLVDSGKLALDEPVENYLPEFREQKDTNGLHHAFTIRQVMSHTSGLVPNPPTRRSAWPIGGPLDDFWLQQELPDIAQTIARTQLRFKPGSKFEYSNSALFVLGRVIEVVAGKPYAAYVKEKILEPLGMTDTHYAPPAGEAKRIAVIYAQRNGKRETIFRFNPAVKISNTAPDGGLFSYPAQLVPFLQMFLSNDGRVLSPSAVAEMLREQPQGWGLGWSLPDRLFLHEGSSGTLAWGDPRKGVIGILFLQFRDQKDSDARLRKRFLEAIQKASADGASAKPAVKPGAKAGQRHLPRFWKSSPASYAQKDERKSRPSFCSELSTVRSLKAWWDCSS
jgi:CubicO group peptidase (beta-lactamase class C family)